MDGSRSAKRAFARAVYLARKCDSKLDVVHVVSCEFGGDSAATFELVEDLKAGANEILEQCEKIASRNNISIRTLSDIGDPAKTIIGLANNNDYDLTVMGNRGLGAFKELLLGSVTLRVAHHTKCTIMIVR